MQAQRICATRRIPGGSDGMLEGAFRRTERGMKRFFKWAGIVLGGLVGAIVLLIIGVVVVDRLTRDDPNKDVAIFRVEPAPGGGPLELVSARKHDGDKTAGKTIGWRLYLRNKGATALPGFPLASWDGDIPPAIAWWSATDANICVPIRRGIIKFQMSEGLTTTTSPGGQFEGTLNGFKFQVNHTCPAS
jgi:hypothetical protein